MVGKGKNLYASSILKVFHSDRRWRTEGVLSIRCRKGKVERPRDYISRLLCVRETRTEARVAQEIERSPLSNRCMWEGAASTKGRNSKNMKAATRLLLRAMRVYASPSWGVKEEKGFSCSYKGEGSNLKGGLRGSPSCSLQKGGQGKHVLMGFQGTRRKETTDAMSR